MGAMTLDPIGARSYPLNAALMSAMPKVLTKTAGMKAPQWAWLTHGDTSAVTTGRNFGAISSVYGLTTWGSSSIGKVVPWGATQQWLCYKDRSFRVMEIYPKDGEQNAVAVTANLLLGYGGTAWGTPKEIKVTDDRHYQYGDLTVTVHETNFGLGLRSRPWSASARRPS